MDLSLMAILIQVKSQEKRRQSDDLFQGVFAGSLVEKWDFLENLGSLRDPLDRRMGIMCSSLRRE
jgi:hypothetical protein